MQKFLSARFWFFKRHFVPHVQPMIEWPYQRLEAWNLAHEFALEISALARTLPTPEKYALATQMIRAARSVKDNIAEGNSASGPGVYQRHIGIALGSLGETDNHLLTAREEGYLTEGRVRGIPAERLANSWSAPRTPPKPAGRALDNAVRPYVVRPVPYVVRPYVVRPYVLRLSNQQPARRLD